MRALRFLREQGVMRLDGAMFWFPRLVYCRRAWVLVERRVQGKWIVKRPLTLLGAPGPPPVPELIAAAYLTPP